MQQPTEIQRIYQPTVRWNLTRKRRMFRDADALVLSVAKSGRTWFRVMLSKYLALHFDAPLAVDGFKHDVPGMPHVLYSHELWSHTCTGNVRRRLTGHYICSDRFLATKPAIVVHRDPRDVLVSLYFHASKRSRDPFHGTLADLVRDPRLGIRPMVRVMNNWRHRLGDGESRLWIGYADLHADAEGFLSRAVELLGLSPRPELIGEAVEFSRFDNMKQMETKGDFGTRFLAPGDRRDPESFKVRSGKVGGYREHLSEADLDYIEEVLAELDPFFGYR